MDPQQRLLLEVVYEALENGQWLSSCFFFPLGVIGKRDVREDQETISMLCLLTRLESLSLCVNGRISL